MNAAHSSSSRIGGISLMTENTDKIGERERGGGGGTRAEDRRGGEL